MCLISEGNVHSAVFFKPYCVYRISLIASK